MSDPSDEATLLVNIDVGDLRRAIAFYTAGLGLTVRRHLGPSIVELRGGSSAVFLCLLQFLSSGYDSLEPA